MTTRYLLAVTFFWAAAIVAPGLSSAARAEMVQFHAMMSGGAEVPPTNTTGTGEATATLDTATKTLNYTVNYSGLTGPATMGL